MADTKEYQTIIGEDAKFKGELEFDSSAKVLGKVEGSIQSKGRVLIDDGATCKATVTAKELSVAGDVEGNVEAGDRLEVLANGKITGDVVAARMNMAEGASINGYCRIGVNGAAGGAKSSSATTEVKPTASSSSDSSKATATAAKK